MRHYHIENVIYEPSIPHAEEIAAQVMSPDMMSGSLDVSPALGIPVTRRGGTEEDTVVRNGETIDERIVHPEALANIVDHRSEKSDGGGIFGEPME